MRSEAFVASMKQQYTGVSWNRELATVSFEMNLHIDVLSSLLNDNCKSEVYIGSLVDGLKISQRFT